MSIQETEFIVIVCTCERCSHEWHPLKTRFPKMCPKCKSRLWNKRKPSQSQNAEMSNLTFPKRSAERP